MKCPSCGNYAKMPSAVFFGLSMLKFKCQFCNEWLRGGFLMVFLDFLSIALYVASLFLLVANAESLAPWFGELTFPILGVLGAVAIRVPITWLKMHVAQYELAN